MVIFNHTFTQGKPVYFPDNWDTGKTAIQLHQQWKQTLSFALLSNTFQVIGSVGWIFIIILVILASREIKRLSQLKDSSLEKMENRKYIRWNFIIPMIIMAVAWLAVTSAFMFMDEWNRLVLLKGILGWGLILTIYHVYPKCKSLYVNYKKYKSGRNKVHNNNSSLLSTNKTIYSQ